MDEINDHSPNPAIVIVAFNRKNSLNRILKSLESAEYPNKEISLIISIDYSETNKDVLEAAQKFNWIHGNKTINYQNENLGLKKHILKSMEYVYEYENIIMLEDDLYVSPDFYNYTIKALGFVREDNDIAGISLYKHEFNVHTTRNFSNFSDGFDNWYFQFASSWGQAWNKAQITSFLNWFENKPIIDNCQEIPSYVRQWSEKSWLKYFIAYAVLQNKFFLYPSYSLTTNFGDQGTHMDTTTSCYQVPLLFQRKRKYNFSKLDESLSIYDSFYENIRLSEILNIDKKNLTVDLYDYKKDYSKRYVLTSAVLDFKIVRSFGKYLKPHDANVINDIEGSDLFLYDTEVSEGNTGTKDRFNDILYDFKHVTIASSYILLLGNLKKRIKSYLNRMTKWFKS
jgi:glycosyltransferase involved in cell wall biosynthesis